MTKPIARNTDAETAFRAEHSKRRKAERKPREFWLIVEEDYINAIVGSRTMTLDDVIALAIADFPDGRMDEDDCDQVIWLDKRVVAVVRLGSDGMPVVVKLDPVPTN
jgi:hypothetical protein